MTVFTNIQPKLPWYNLKPFPLVLLFVTGETCPVLPPPMRHCYPRVKHGSCIYLHPIPCTGPAVPLRGAEHLVSPGFPLWLSDRFLHIPALIRQKQHQNVPKSSEESQVQMAGVRPLKINSLSGKVTIKESLLKKKRYFIGSFSCGHRTQRTPTQQSQRGATSCLDRQRQETKWLKYCSDRSSSPPTRKLCGLSFTGTNSTTD